MKNRDELMNFFINEVDDLEKKINNISLYNLRAYVAKTLVKSGIAIDYALPFILSAIVIYECFNEFGGNRPFFVDEIVRQANVKRMYTSTGFFHEKSSFDYEYFINVTFEHTTGWEFSNGMFGRIITSYRMNDDIKWEEAMEVLTMTKEEVDNLFVITNVETIYKDVLDIEDSLYTEDMLIITNNWKDEEICRLDKETAAENFGSTGIYLFSVLGLGSVGTIIKNRLLGNCISNKLKKIYSRFVIIDKVELDELKKLLLIKKENLSLLDGADNNLKGNDRYYKRVKKR